MYHTKRKLARKSEASRDDGDSVAARVIHRNAGPERDTRAGVDASHANGEATRHPHNDLASYSNGVAARRSQHPGRETVPYDSGPDVARVSARYGLALGTRGEAQTVQRLEAEHGPERVRGWVEEGMTVGTMGKPRDMQAFRERQAARPDEVPSDIERQNEASAQRSTEATREDGPAGDGSVSDEVRRVVSSPGTSMDGAVQREMESRMGGDFSDVRLHTGPDAAAAAESINARAFTVGNHVAFNDGEYDPGSDEGKKVLAHELTHVRQQTGGRVSMLPKADAAHPGLGSPTGSDVHVQPKLEVSSPDDPAEKEAEAVAAVVVERDEPGSDGREHGGGPARSSDRSLTSGPTAIRRLGFSASGGSDSTEGKLQGGLEGSYEGDGLELEAEGGISLEGKVGWDVEKLGDSGQYEVSLSVGVGVNLEGDTEGQLGSDDNAVQSAPGTLSADVEGGIEGGVSYTQTRRLDENTARRYLQLLEAIDSAGPEELLDQEWSEFAVIAKVKSFHEQGLDALQGGMAGVMGDPASIEVLEVGERYRIETHGGWNFGVEGNAKVANRGFGVGITGKWDQESEWRTSIEVERLDEDVFGPHLEGEEPKTHQITVGVSEESEHESEIGVDFKAVGGGISGSSAEASEIVSVFEIADSNEHFDGLYRELVSVSSPQELFDVKQDEDYAQYWAGTSMESEMEEMMGPDFNVGSAEISIRQGGFEQGSWDVTSEGIQAGALTGGQRIGGRIAVGNRDLLSSEQTTEATIRKLEAGGFDVHALRRSQADHLRGTLVSPDELEEFALTAGRMSASAWRNIMGFGAKIMWFGDTEKDYWEAFRETLIHPEIPEDLPDDLQELWETIWEAEPTMEREVAVELATQFLNCARAYAFPQLIEEVGDPGVTAISKVRARYSGTGIEFELPERYVGDEHRFADLRHNDVPLFVTDAQAELDAMEPGNPFDPEVTERGIDLKLDIQLLKDQIIDLQAEYSSHSAWAGMIAELDGLHAQVIQPLNALYQVSAWDPTGDVTDFGAITIRENVEELEKSVTSYVSQFDDGVRNAAAEWNGAENMLYANFEVRDFYPSSRDFYQTWADQLEQIELHLASHPDIEASTVQEFAELYYGVSVAEYVGDEETWEALTKLEREMAGLNPLVRSRPETWQRMVRGQFG